MTTPLAALDASLGDNLERLISAHHHRRLRKLGWEHALTGGPGRWGVGGPPPREGCGMEILIDGAEAFPAMVREVRSARSHVHVAGWHAQADFALTREDPPLALRDLLTEATEHAQVRVLLWSGSPAPLFHPWRAEVRRDADRLVAGTAIRCALDTRQRLMHCHHEKLLVIDDRVAFVGGLDLTYLAGDRFDHGEHPLRSGVGWHDMCARITGPAVADVANHFRLRWQEVASEQLPPPVPTHPDGDVTVQVVRTVPEGEYGALPRGDFSGLSAYLAALRSANRLIYLENQFLWSPEVVEVLADKLRRPPRPDFRLLLVLPAKPYRGGDDTRGQLGVLAEADAGAGRFLACTLNSIRDGVSRPVYVHAKFAVVDDSWMTLGSTNLNEHSLFNDSEVNVVTDNRELARSTRERLWAEHLEVPVSRVRGDPVRVINELWQPIAAEQAARQRTGRPFTHRLTEMPNVSRRSARLMGPLQGVFVDG